MRSSKLEAAYKAVDWKKFEIAANKPNPFSLPKLEAMKKAAIAEMNGNAAKLRAAAFAARDAAKKAAGDLKKNPLTKGAGAVCDQIEKAADFMGVGANGNSLGGYIQKDVDEAKNAFDVTAKAIKTKIPSTVSALKNAIKAAGNPTTPEAVEGGGDDDQVPRPEPAHRQRAQAHRDGLRPRHGHRQGKSFFEDMRVYASKECPFEDEQAPKPTPKKALAAVSRLAQRAAVF